MENSTRLVQENRNFPSSPSSSSMSPLNSPHGNGNNNNRSNCNGVFNVQIQNQTPPLTPIPISSRSDQTNPYPTTFVQADTTTFKQVVQMLTGSSQTTKQASSSSQQQQQQQKQDPPLQLPLPSKASSFPIPPIKTNFPKKPSFKLYERRNSNLKNNLIINTFVPNYNRSPSSFTSPRHNNTEILSPSMLDFPKLALSSPVTPLNEDPFNKSLGNSSSSSEEDKAIAEKGFYLHPSPMSTPRDSEPQLLPLFPLTSPRVSGSSN